MSLTATHLSLNLSGRRILSDVSIEIPEGRVTALIGPNGSGKSTLLRCMAGLINTPPGAITLGGQPLHTLPRREIARRLAFLPQTPILPEGITVRRLVDRGRTPYLGTFRPMTARDRAVVEAALARTALTEMAERPAAKLSGGQRQRAFIAMTLAQNTPVMLLDEPTTYLDLPHQVEILKLMQSLNRSEGQTIVMVLHDLALACRYADHIIGLKAGRTAFAGPPQGAATTASLSDLFDAPLRVLHIDGEPAPVVLPG